jgi:acyl-CoA synthetase (AMP-forming)/AMP-acid ligase II
VVAAVRVPEGRTPPDEEELRLALRERLSAYKVPTRLLFLADDEVPMMSSGKLDAPALREWFS